MEAGEKVGSFTFEKSFQEPVTPPVTPPEDIIMPPAEPPTEPPAEPPATPPTEPDYKAEVETWKSKATEHETLAKTYEQQVADYKTKVEQLSKPVNPFEGDDDGALFYKLSQVKKANPDLYPVLKEAALGDPDNAKLWKLNFLKDHPELKDKPEVVQRKLERTFPALYQNGSVIAAPDETEYPTEYQEYQDQLSDLQIDGTKIKKEFLTHLDGIKLPEVEDKAVKDATTKAQKEALAKSWQQDFNKMESGELKTKFEVPVSDKENLTIEIEIPKELKEKYLKSAAQLVLATNTPNTAETVKQVESIMWREYIADNFQAEAGKMLKTALDKRDEQWKKITGGKTPIQSTTVETTGAFDGRKDFADKLRKHSRQF